MGMFTFETERLGDGMTTGGGLGKDDVCGCD
jgi:hypothetical protein